MRSYYAAVVLCIPAITLLISAIFLHGQDQKVAAIAGVAIGFLVIALVAISQNR